MRAVIQRVRSASVTVAGERVADIQHGILALIGIASTDTPREADQLARKIVTLKLWDEGVSAVGAAAAADGALPQDEVQDDTPEASSPSSPRPWRRNVKDINGQILCVSQFTLLARVQKGSKPDFHAAARGEAAKSLYDTFLSHVRQALPGQGVVQDGVFGAMMDVALVNDGPVTILIDTDKDK